MEQRDDPMSTVILMHEGKEWVFLREDIRKIYAGELQPWQIKPLYPAVPETVEATTGNRTGFCNPAQDGRPTEPQSEQQK